MMNPLKLFLLTLGTASLLAVAPSVVSKLIPAPALARQADRPGEMKASPPSQMPEAMSPGAALTSDSVGPNAAKTLVVSSDKIVAAPAARPSPTPAPTPVPIPYRAEVARAQELLSKVGIEAGKVDGKRGQRTEAALRQYQKKHGLPQTGEADKTTVASLEAAAAELAKPVPTPAVAVATAEMRSAELPAPDAPSATVITDADEPLTIAAASAPVPAVTDAPVVKTPAPTPETPKPKPSPAVDPQYVILGEDGRIEKPASPPAPAEADEVPQAAAPAPLPDFDPDDVPTLRNMKDVRTIQHALKAVGAYPDAPDGKWGNKTIVAMREFQQREELKVTGKPNRETWKRLVEEAESAPAPAAPVTETASRDDKAIPARLLTQTPPETSRTEAVSGAVASRKIEEKSAPAPAAVATPAVETPPDAEESPDAPIAVAPSKLVVAESGPGRTPPSAPLTLAAPEILEISKPAPPPAAQVQPEPAPVEQPREAAEAEPDAPAPQEPEPVKAVLVSASAPAPDPFAPSAKPAADKPAEAAAPPAAGEPDSASLPAPVPSAAETTSAPEPTSPIAEAAAAPDDAPETTEPPEKTASEPAPAEPKSATPDQTLPTPVPVSEVAVASVSNLPEPDSEDLPAEAPPASAVEVAANEEVVPSLSASGRLVASADPVPSKNASADAPVRSGGVPSIRVNVPTSKASMVEADRVKGLGKRVADAKAAVETAAADSRLEIAKYAPARLKTASELIEKAEKGIKAEGQPSSPEETEKTLQSAEKELSEAKSASLRGKAEEKTAEIKSAYTQLKSRFSEAIRSDSELADIMTKVDAGYEAMMGDFEKSKYEPIVDLGDGFKLSIDQLSKLAAKEYVSSQLEKRAVKSKLKSSQTREIEKLREDEKFLEAADVLDAAVKKEPAKESVAKKVTITDAKAKKTPTPKRRR